MTDRFHEMAGRVQLDMESYAMRQSIDGRRRVIAEALKAAYERGHEEGLAAHVEAERARADKYERMYERTMGDLGKAHGENDRLREAVRASGDRALAENARADALAAALVTCVTASVVSPAAMWDAANAARETLAAHAREPVPRASDRAKLQALFIAIEQMDAQAWEGEDFVPTAGAWHRVRVAASAIKGALYEHPETTP